MFAVGEKAKRESLFREISEILRQWPELDRKIFAQAHYQGKSLEAISQSLQLNIEEVSIILRQCDRRLQASLSNFRKGGYENPSLVQNETMHSTARRQDFERANISSSRVNHILDVTKIPA